MLYRTDLAGNYWFCIAFLQVYFGHKIWLLIRGSLVQVQQGEQQIEALRMIKSLSAFLFVYLLIDIDHAANMNMMKKLYWFLTCFNFSINTFDLKFW